MFRPALALPLFLAASTAHAQIAIGEYATRGGAFTLQITPGAFEILGAGANGDTCTIDGTRKGATGRAADAGKTCVVTFAARPDGVEVKTQTRAICARFCGAEATIEGVYLKVAAGCSDKARDRTQKAVDAATRAKDDAKVEALLAQQLEVCAKTLPWLDGVGARTDLAAAQMRQGRKADCLKTLEPLIGDADASDEKLQEKYSSFDLYRYEGALKDLRETLKQCRA
ncbi:MAG TPA: hypothetical protein PKA55_05350 [Rhodoblastus sp.]|mgnify:CR=1 FL=1|nr:hypothetical protein [Rhodoblastus sp.]